MKEFYTMIQGIGELQRELRSFFSGVKLPAYPPQFLKYQLVTNHQQHYKSVVLLLSALRADLFGVYLHEAPVANYAKGVSRFTP